VSPASSQLADHYAVLGIAQASTAGEIRRAYRLLALRHHPDRAGPTATALFQRIAEAYRVLSDPAARFLYDALMREGRRVADGRDAGPSSAPDGYPRVVLDPSRQRAADGTGPGRFANLLHRLTGPFEILVARSAARRCPDGIVELFLTPAEAERGGTAAIEISLRVPCPTCGGVAERNRVWCIRCEFEGTVLDPVTVCIAIRPRAPDGTVFSVHVDRLGAAPPLRVRIRI
jgi:DnaJ-class molecular chaperone